VTTPCQADPAAFALEGSATPADLIEACTYCPILAQCRADFTAQPHERYGVIAGLYRPYPATERDETQIGADKWNRLLAWLHDFCDTAEPGTPVPNARQLRQITGIHQWGCNLALKEVEARGLTTSAERRGYAHHRFTLPVPGSELEQEEAEAS
jgi:hypothetical protein